MFVLCCTRYKKEFDFLAESAFFLQIPLKNREFLHKKQRFIPTIDLFNKIKLKKKFVDLQSRVRF